MRNILFISFLVISTNLFSQTKVWVRQGFPGHCVVSVGDSLFYSFGNYQRKGIGMLFSAEGVLVRSNKQFQGFRGIKPIVVDRSESDVIRFCDSVYNSSTTHISDEARVVMLRYRLLNTNCATTFVSEAVGLEKTILPTNVKQKLRGKYFVTSGKIIGWAAMSIAGSFWGGREALYADPTVFERKFGATPYSFFGSHQWERKYEGNRYLGQDGIPNKMKSQVFGNFGRDYWHTSNYVVFGITGSFVFERGCSKQRLLHKLVDISIGSACFLILSRLTYNYLRK